MMYYTVKDLSELAGVSIRTLHYYDEINLLTPSMIGENGYRYYDDDAVLQLQQILLFREMDLSLGEIKALVKMPDFDVVQMLQEHRSRLYGRIRRLNDLIHTVDSTITYMKGETTMSKKQLFSGFSKEDEERYAEEARQRWGSDEVNASYKRWNSYSKEKQEQVKAEGKAIYAELVDVIDTGPGSEVTQALIARWHQHMRYFYEPSIERLRGLGDLYNDDPKFAENFAEMHPNLAAFMRDAINHYCDQLEATD